MMLESPSNPADRDSRMLKLRRMPPDKLSEMLRMSRKD